MSAQPTELFARLIDLFGNPATADPTKLYGNLTVNSSGQIVIGSGTQLVLPDSTQVSIAAMGRNRIINGEMMIWQRATSVTGSLSGYQTVDRFACTTNSGSGHTAALAVDAPSGLLNSFKLTVGTGASPAAGNNNNFWQNIEGYNVTDFNYGLSTASYGVLTFWVKSSIAGTYGIGFLNSGATRNYTTTYTINSTNTWEQKTIVVPGDITGSWNTSNGIGLSINWDLGAGSTYQTSTTNTWQSGATYTTATATKLIATSGATWQITGVQFEKGQYARPLERRSFALEFELCQRYYTYLNAIVGTNISDGTNQAQLWFPTVMRAAPTITTVNGNGGSWISFGPEGMRANANAAAFGGCQVQCNSEL